MLTARNWYLDKPVLTTEQTQGRRDVKVEVMVWLMSYMIRVLYGDSRAHPLRRPQISRKDIHRASPISPTDKWLSLRDLIIVAVGVPTVEGCPRDYKEITLFWQWRRQARTAREKTIPTSGEISLFIIAFLWYLYLLFLYLESISFV